MTPLERLEERLHGADMAISELERAWWLDRSNPDAVAEHSRRLSYAKGFRSGIQSAVTLVRSALEHSS